MNPSCKCKANKSQHCTHDIFHTKINLRLLGHWDWFAVVGSGGYRGAFRFCGGNFSNSQILKAKGRTGLQGDDFKLTLQEIYPVWPRNDAFP
jgi:hypothetical protein